MNGDSKYTKEGEAFLKEIRDVLAGARNEERTTRDENLRRKLRVTIKELEEAEDAVEHYMMFGTWFIFGPAPGR